MRKIGNGSAQEFLNLPFLFSFYEHLLEQGMGERKPPGLRVTPPGEEAGTSGSQYIKLDEAKMQHVNNWKYSR
ncbi:hypothetical protein A8L34_04735 [Bacillus sp. FJAT-27264]|nr:hypothetical protein A8L34_04735 [Bacillus sp. FJAT-27264]